MNAHIKKNLLDLEYNTNLQYFNTAIIVLFTYFIGVGITFMTKQIDYTSKRSMIILEFMSILVLFVIVFLLVKFRRNIKHIKKEIKEMKFSKV